MGFYEEISKYYDYIFPVGKEQVNFIMKVVGKPPKALLDVACGTGGYAIEFAKQGYAVTAIDLDSKMIEALRTKILSHSLTINALQGNMLELSNQLNTKYDLAFCIGNSLVHLDEEKEIEIFLKEMKSSLNTEGSLVIQVINYDRVLANNVRSLPTIENEEIGLKFKRIYRHDPAINKIFFKTILEVGGNVIENEIPLYPILADNIVALLSNAGYNKVQLYGDFKGSEFDKNNSYALVLVAS
ncbi:class I SAM-dependent methyltransferase [Geosporobacter ferrireducens]|uniref:Methyltransferase type 11 n=1 Tax=Geosporobacter ferrireducens TaxID=1424294 RepID=A0A1D8GMC6_9FIRM|nr:class I SAM-dependent methyltransferase [Geosporobacter ferrireducens]AOT72047.1 methyltransferase type 11 [Geosporobacter ferrireducens]MTI55930.1 class I SAM-dependent methyltransferase [Geosporobacter ferrireducens]